MAKRPTKPPVEVEAEALPDGTAALRRIPVTNEIIQEGTPDPEVIFAGLGPLAAIWLGREIVSELVSVLMLATSDDAPEGPTRTDELSEAMRAIARAMGNLSYACASVGLLSEDEIAPPGEAVTL